MIVFKGANSYGQLGLGNVDDHLLPQKVTQFWKEGDPPKFIAGGGGHTAVITGANFDFYLYTLCSLYHPSWIEVNLSICSFVLLHLAMLATQ